MKIYVQSAGKTIEHDYDWKGDFDETTKRTDSNPPRSWHVNLKEGDKALGLLAGYANGAWHVEYRNLILPGITDFRGRQIVQNIIFSGLQSSDEVRALVHAYLDIELRFKTSGRPVGRVCPELAACYSATNDGDFAFDYRKAEDWAKKAIDAYKPDALQEPKWQSITGRLNPANEDEVQQLRELINTLELEESNGLQIAFSQVSIVRVPTLRLNLAYTNITGELTCEELRRSNMEQAKKFAIARLVETQEQAKNGASHRLSKKIWAIFLILTLGGLGAFLFYYFSKKSEKDITVKAPPPPLSVDVPKKEEQNQDKKPATPGDASDAKNASIAPPDAAAQNKSKER
ncbi:MAG: hypothetical protein IJA63_04005 [Akkermansia sp.]|nr:hypothetical protein [Akkermansia sp.]